MTAIRRAEAIWAGDLASGEGTVSGVSSGLFSSLPVSWAARIETPGGKTSPEELLAAAHASCYVDGAAAAPSLVAARRRPNLAVSADVTFDQVGTGWRVVSSHLTVEGTVPGISEADFIAAAEAAKDGCPISQALKGNVELTVDATLVA